MRRIGLKGMFTVEAAILIPFLMILTITAISYVVYVCDRSMMIQDANAACSDIRTGNTETDLSGHPYFLVEDAVLSVSRENGTLTVRSSGTWYCPVWSDMNAVITGEQSVQMSGPVKIMRITKDIQEKKTKLEENNVSDRIDP